MSNKPITVIFLSKSSIWPRGLDPEQWDLCREAFYEWKNLCGAHLPGMVLIMGAVAVGGVSPYLAKDSVSKRKVLDYLRNQGYSVEIDVENSPY